MSEQKRFEQGEEYGEGDLYIWDNVSHQEIWVSDDISEVCDLLNEYQSIISALKKEIKELKEKLDDVLELTEFVGMTSLRKAEIKSIVNR